MLRVPCHLLSLSTDCYLLDNSAQNIPLMFSVPTLVEFTRTSVQHESFFSQLLGNPRILLLSSPFLSFWKPVMKKFYSFIVVQRQLATLNSLMIYQW